MISAATENSMKYLFSVFSFMLCAIYGMGQPSSLQTIVQKGHDQAVLSVAISPDSNYAATGSRDKTIKLWELSTGREVRTFFGHEGSVNCIDFSRDGNYMISSSGDKTARIWDVLTGKEIFSTTPAAKLLTAAAFSPDMKYFVIAGYPDMATIWDMSTKQIVRQIPVNADQGLGYGINVEFSPDGKWLAFGEDNRTVTVYSTSDWESKFIFKQEEGWCGGCATWVAFTHDSRSLVMASNKGPVRHYSLVSGDLIREYTHEENDVVNASVTSSNKEIVVVTKKQIVTWELGSGNEISRITVPAETEINEGALTPDGKQILLACDNNTAMMWDRGLHKTTVVLTGILNQRDKGGVAYDPNSYWESHIAKYLRLKNNLLLSMDGKSLLKGKFGTSMRQWDIATGRTFMEYVSHDKAAVCYEFSGDGKLLLSGGADGKVILWDVATGDTIKIIQAHREPVFDVHFSKDERRVICSSWDATAKIFDLTTGERLHYFDFENASAYNIQFSNNNLYVFAAHLDKTLKMWEADTKRVVREFVGHTDVISSICMSKDPGKMVSGSWDGSIRLWSTATGLAEMKYDGHSGGVYAVAFSSDEKHLFSGGADRLIKIWDVPTGKLIRTLEGHQAEVTSIVFSKDEKMLISHSTDGVTKFWDLNTGREFFEHIHLGDRDWMVKTADGYFSGTEGARQSIHFVNGMKTWSADQFFDEFYRPELLPQIFKTRGATETRESIQGSLKSSPPPLVRVATIAGADPAKIELFVKITDQGGGAGDLKIFHNGKNVPLPKEALKYPEGRGQSAVYKQHVEVVGGRNIFTVSASSRDNIESDPESAEYFSEHVSKSSACYIMAVGINEYKNPGMNLNYARPDAQSFTSMIGENADRLFKTTELHTFYDRDASREKILAMLDELASKIHPEDVFIFYYAGHGSMVDARFFFIPSESLRLYDQKALEKEAIEASVLQDKFRNIKALKQLIIMDACQSGGSVELLATRGGGEEKAIAQLSRSAGIHVLASAGSEQLATEFSELGHGLFTYVLIRALNGEADGAPKDGKVTIYEIKSFIDDQMPDLTRKLKGKPQYPYTFSRGQDFPVVIGK